MELSYNMSEQVEVSVAAEKHRIQIDFTPAARDSLRALTEATGSGTMTETIRNAMALYEVLGPAILRGAAIIVRERDGSEARVVLAR